MWQFRCKFGLFLDSGDCAAQGISGVKDLDAPGIECAAVGPVLASEYLYHDRGH